MQVVHLVEEGPEDHPEVLGRLVVLLARHLRFVVARIADAVVNLLFLVEIHVVVVTFRVEVVLVQETFGEEVIDDQERIGAGRVHLVVVASMVVDRATFVGAMAIVDEVGIDGRVRSVVDQVHLDELERIVALVICDQVRGHVSRLLLHRLVEMVIEDVRQRIASEDHVDRGKVHDGVGIVGEEIVDEATHLASRHQVRVIGDDQSLLVVGSGHLLAEVGFFVAFSPLPLE